LEGEAHGQAPVHGGADRVCAEAGRRGTPVPELCRKLGVAEATFYRWKKQYAGLGVAEIRRLKQLEDENRRLKKLVAEQALDIAALKDVTSRNW
jgi:putative transposase